MPVTATTASKNEALISNPSRIAALDFTKGVLVLFMVLYHWLNYFYTPNGDFYRYLRFLTPSFIFITGFLISHVNLAKYGTSNERLPKRLAVRGLKLLGIFVVMNAIIAFLPGSQTRFFLAGNSAFASLIAVFITGNVSSQFGKTASFGILESISYLLLISAALLPISRVFRYTFHAIGGATLVFVFALGFFDIHSTNLEALALGLLGIVCGYVPGATINRIVSHTHAILVAYFCFLLAVTIWDVPFGLRIVSVCLTLLAIYGLGNWNRVPCSVRSHIILLGRYSLFGYIWQIAVLQLLHRIMGHSTMRLGEMATSFFAGFALTMGGVEALDRLRPKSRTLDQLYRIAFA
jgi:peptidoglycan/LPS O-acetylase OafA/YrhL